MASILYLSNKLVQFAEAKRKGKTVKVREAWQEEAPEGSIINGIITDEEAFLAWIKDFFTRNKLPKKDITLVVNSSQFNYKVLEFPRFKDSEIKKMIPREYAEHRTESTLFTYYTLEGDNYSKKQKILATAVEKEFLLSYINLFRQAGIEISAIDSEISCLVRLFSNSPEIRKKTCLIQVLDGREVISMLFLKGNYYYSQKNRLFNQDPMEGLAQELESIRDRLFQFITSQQIREPVEAVYLCGTGQNDLKKEMEEDKIFSGKDVIFKEKSVRKKNIEFLYPIGSLLGKRQGATFFRQLKQEQKEKKKQREMLKLFLPSGVVLIVCFLTAAYMGRSYYSGLKELERLQLQENRMANEKAGYEMALASVDAMRYKIGVVEDTWEHLMSYPVINSSIEQVLAACAGSDVSVEIKSFQRDSGVLTIEAQTNDVKNVNGFIAKLQEQDIFEAVEYSGYTYVSGADHYGIHVVCCMAEGAGR